MKEEEPNTKIKPDRESIIAWAVRWAKRNDPQPSLFDKKKEEEDADAA